MDKMKTVLILNPCLYTNGGGEKYMGYFCQYLENTFDNIKIDILVYDYNGIHVDSESYTTIDDLNGKFGLELKHTFIKKVKRDFGRLYGESILLNQRIEKISKKYDIFVNWNFLSKQCGKADYNVYLCMFPPKKYVYKECKWITRCYRRYIDRLFPYKYDKYICISSFTKKWLNNYWPEISPEKYCNIYPPVYSKKHYKYNESEKKNIILCVGRFFIAGHNKKQREMLKMFLDNEKKLSNYEFHLVGSVSENEDDRRYLKEIQLMASSSKAVHFHVGCKMSQLQELYRSAKIFWHATGFGIDENAAPGEMEHFGITTVEAMSYGVVPVVINKGGQREIVTGGVNGYLWDDFESCVQCTIDLICNESKRIKMANAAIETSECFSIESFYEACDKQLKLSQNDFRKK